MHFIDREGNMFEVTDLDATIRKLELYTSLYQEGKLFEHFDPAMKAYFLEVLEFLKKYKQENNET